MQFESHLGHSVSAGQRLFSRRVWTKLDLLDSKVYMQDPLGGPEGLRCTRYSTSSSKLPVAAESGRESSRCVSELLG